MELRARCDLPLLVGFTERKDLRSFSYGNCKILHNLLSLQVTLCFCARKCFCIYLVFSRFPPTPHPWQQRAGLVLGFLLPGFGCEWISIFTACKSLSKLWRDTFAGMGGMCLNASCRTYQTSDHCLGGSKRNVHCLTPLLEVSGPCVEDISAPFYLNVKLGLPGKTQVTQLDLNFS